MAARATEVRERFGLERVMEMWDDLVWEVTEEAGRGAHG
jgi:hypothetical protein